MSWLRIDDRFSRHPKVTQLTYKERWIWMDLLCYCAAYQTGGYLPDNIADLVTGVTAKYLKTCVGLELVDVTESDELRIHDWENYAPKDPTAAERQAAWRGRKKRNGVTVGVTEETSTSREGTRAQPVPSRPLALSEAVVLDAEGTASVEIENVKSIIDRQLKEAS